MKIKITGLPKYQTKGLVGPDPDDEWIRRIMEYEAKQGGYDASRGAYGLPNWGYNSKIDLQNQPINPNTGKAWTIEDAIGLYKTDFLPKVQNYPMGMRERAGDFIYNTGRDPRVYMLDQYLRTVGDKKGLANRTSYNIDMNANPNAWAKISPQFETEWNKYSADINKLPLDQQIKFLDQGRDFYYQNINRVGNDPNPAYAATWQPRINMFGTYSAPVNTNAGVQTNTGTNTGVNTGSNTGELPLLKMQTNNIERKPLDLPPSFGNITRRPTPQLQPNNAQFIGPPAPDECPAGQTFSKFQQKCVPIDDPEEKGLQWISDWRSGKIKNSLKTTGNEGTYSNPMGAGAPETITTTTIPPKGMGNDYGIALASTIGSGLSFFGNTLKAAQLARDQNTFGRMYGQTDASNPVVKNAYSRGRNVMNTGEYAPNMMTPVQFAGRPVTEYTGYPTYPYNIYAQDGLNVTRDILGMSSLYSDPGMIPRVGEEILPPTLSAGSGASSSQPLTEGSFENNTSLEGQDFVLPLKNIRITSGFGPRKAPFKGASTNHNGVDLAVPVNTSVFSPYDGVVVSIWGNPKVTGGLQLKVKHDNGYTTGYAHLNGYNVKVGDRVTKGQQIALSGNTGPSTGAHLHFTLRNPNGEPIDPVDFFNLRGSKKNRDYKGLSNWDHNNPGNIHIEGDFAKGYGAVQGRKDGKGHVAIFPTMQSGMTAMRNLIFSSNYMNLTVSQARNRWVNGDVNATTTSTPHIVKAVGADIPLSQLSDKQKSILFEEFVKWEDRSVYDKLKKEGYFQQEGVVMASSNNNNNMRIRITGTPGNNQFADGGRTVGDQMGYGLYRGQSVRDFDAFYKQDEDDYASNVKSTEHGVPRPLATIEAEDGEKAIAKDGMSILDIKGKKHSQGGTPMDAEPGSYIVSDFITAPKTMQAAMGFEVPSKKKKDNTWARVLDSKVKSKDYNKLSQILQAAAAGDPVDRFELAMAEAKMPVYQDYVSKAVLGNELSKMLQGKPYDIPEIAMPAMMKLFPEAAEQIMMQQQNQIAQQQQMEQLSQFTGQQPPVAKWGMHIKNLPEYKTRGLVDLDPDPLKDLMDKYPWFKPFVEAKTEKGRVTRKGKKLSSLYDPNVANQYQNLDYWVKDAASKGVAINDISSLQRYIYIKLSTDPTGQVAIQKMWEDYGPTLKSEDQNIDNFADAFAGARTAFLLSQVPITTTLPPPQTTLPPATLTTTVRPKDPPEEVITQFETPGGDLRKFPYTQDIINFGSALANQYAYPNIGPGTGRYNPYFMDPAFRSTEANRRLLQSQARTAMEDASLYGSAPQTLNARQSQINTQLLPAMIQDDVQTNAMNIQTDMTARQYNAQVANQAALYDAERITMMNDKLARLAYNRAKEQIAGRTASKNMLNQLITNAGDTFLMNQWYPHGFNPLDYGIYFKKGLGKTIQDQATTVAGTSQSYSELYPAYYADAKKANPNLSEDELHDIAHEQTMLKIKGTTVTNTYDPRRSMMNARRQVRTTSSAGVDNDGTAQPQQAGGFIPMYYVGGWY